MQVDRSQDLARTTVQLLALGVLIAPQGNPGSTLASASLRSRALLRPIREEVVGASYPPAGRTPAWNLLTALTGAVPLWKSL